jgi:histone-lysine N-methyltransferase SETMAR
MLTVFFDCQEIVLHEFVPQGQTVNAAFYVEVLKLLRHRVRRVEPNLRGDNGWILHQDNAPSHTALIVREFLVRNSTTVMNHSPYSLDLAPCEFLLFPKCKLVLRG